MSRLWLLAVCALALTFAGCGTARKTEISWDLSRSHTTRDVSWRVDTDADQLLDVGAVSIRFPGGKTLSEPQAVKRVTMSAIEEPGLVDDMILDSGPVALDVAYRLASRWAEDWGMQKRRLETWRAEQPASGVAFGSSLEYSADETTGRGGPYPGLKVIQSSTPGRPFIVGLVFSWVSDEEGGQPMLAPVKRL